MSDENDLSSPIGTRDARVGGCVPGERGKVQADAGGPADGTAAIELRLSPAGVDVAVDLGLMLARRGAQLTGALQV
jgi:hypothetical protein